MSPTIIDPYHNESYYETHSVVVHGGAGLILTSESRPGILQPLPIYQIFHLGPCTRGTNPPVRNAEYSLSGTASHMQGSYGSRCVRSYTGYRTCNACVCMSLV
jgi:hypothetical protein